MVALLALAWVPLTSHCRLEAIPGLEFLRCSTDAENSTEGDPCKDGGCCSVESAKYQSRQQHVALVVLAAILSEHNFAVVEHCLPSEVSLGILTSAPPELPSSWQFTLRTALPVRAPSLLS